MTTRKKFDELIGDRGRDPEFVVARYAQYAENESAFLAETHSLSYIEQDWPGPVWRDPVHGAVPLREPLIRDIISTPTFERLWQVQQFGDRWAMASLLRSAPHSRGEHGLGTWHLVSRQCPDDISLQAAALLHDAGHTAFSHHGETVFDGERNQEWHEEQLHRIITDDRYYICPVLERHGADPIEVLANLEHPLLDAPKPHLCADRIDYILRDGIASNYVDSRMAGMILDQLGTTDDHRWFFKDPWAGDVMERLLLLLDTAQYSNPMMREVKHQTTALLRHGLERGYLTETDICAGTDDGVLEKLWAARTPDRALDRLLMEFTELGLPRDGIESMGHVMDNYGERFDSFDLPQKRRHIDPLCAPPGRSESNGRDLRPLSEWREAGYDPRGQTGFPEIHLPGIPYLTPSEAGAFGVDREESAYLRDETIVS